MEISINLGSLSLDDPSSSSALLNAIDITGVSNLKLYKVHNVPDSFIGLSGATVYKTVDHDTEYIYRVSIDDQHLTNFLSKIKKLDSFVHVQPNYV